MSDHVCLPLLQGNQKFVESKTKEDPDFFARSARGQKPKYLWIGCSDSRVPVSLVTGTQPGEVFVHRNIANIVANTDLSMLSVVNYAVEHLGVEHVLVVGHYGCGGVAAAISNQNLGLLDNWLRNIKDVYRLHKGELDGLDQDARLRRLVELNVQEQVYNLCKTPFIQDAWSKGRNLQVHGWVYDLHSGRLKDLGVSHEGLAKLDRVYQFDAPQVAAKS